MINRRDFLKQTGLAAGLGAAASAKAQPVSLIIWKDGQRAESARIELEPGNHVRQQADRPDDDRREKRHHGRF